MNIKLTVGLPTFKADEIAWLPMESLCNQIDIDFKWELIVCEELCYENENRYLGKEYFMKYRDRLHKVGCREIKYIDLEGYVTLENKWRFIVSATDNKSKILVLQASDNYSQKDRLKTAYELSKDGAEWIHAKKVYFYNCKTGKIILRDVSNYQYSKGCNISIKIKLLKDMPYRDRGRSVDSWLYDMAKRNGEIKELWDSGNWETGICTDGFNRISRLRINNYKNPLPPFYETNKQIKEIVPEYIYNRLMESKNVCD